MKNSNEGLHQPILAQTVVSQEGRKMSKSKDLQYLQQEYDRVKEEALNYADKDIATKKEFILRLKVKAQLLFEAEERNTSELASYIWNDLTSYGFTIAKSYYSELFTENEKRNYSEKFGTEHIHEFRNVDGIEKCLCTAVKIDGIIYEQTKEEEKKEETRVTIKEKPDPLVNSHTEYLFRVSNNSKELSSIAEDLLKKFVTNKDLRKIITDNLKDIKKLIQQQKDIEAELLAISKHADMRQRIGTFEKIKAILLEKCRYNIAHVAKLLVPPCVKCGHAGITAKHMSANILRKDYEKIVNNLKWFRTIEIFVPGYTTPIIIDIADWFNKQCGRGKLDLDIEEPILVDYKAE